MPTTPEAVSFDPFAVITFVMSVRRHGWQLRNTLVRSCNPDQAENDPFWIRKAKALKVSV
jgi:hypothetical protein